MTKQLQDLHDQIEQACMELSTFNFLKEQEEAAIPRRIEVSVFLLTHQSICDASVLQLDEGIGGDSQRH